MGALLLASVALLPACAASYESQVTRIAKDWSLTIRASQVLPVYPLSEDLQPGDVFLVTQPSNEQQRLYRKIGFLPLDLQVARLDIPTAQYDSYYRQQYFQGAYASAGAGFPRLTRDDNEDPFAEALSVPRTAFPTYSVDVRRSGGFKAALPIQSVPVGVSLLAADSAVATVNIADAYTYAVHPEALARALQTWAGDPANRQRLLDYNRGRSSDEPLFLRVVQRVYLTGGVNVTVTRRSSASGRVDAGASQDLTLLNASDADSIERFAEAQASVREAVNALLEGTTLPGASITAASATSRSVSLNERFDRPLAIGYIATDYEVRPDGSLGAALSTRDVLNGRADYSAIRSGGDDALTGLDIAIAALHDQLARIARDEPERAIAICRASAGGLAPRSPDHRILLDALESDAPPGAVRAAGELAFANDAYRAGEGGAGPKTTQVFDVLTSAFRDN